MKKRHGLLIAAISTVAAAECFNRFYFKYAGKKIGSEFDESIYKWKYGNVRYVTAGTGKPILFVHNSERGGSLCEWNGCISELSKRYRVYAIDLIGYGYSDKPNITYSSYIFVSLIRDFINHVVKEPCSVVSRGDSSQYVMAGYFMNPETYRKFIFISPTGFGNSKNLPGKNASVFKRLFETPVAGTLYYNIMTSTPALYRRFRKSGFYNESSIKNYLLKNAFHSAHYGGVNAMIPFAAQKSGFLNTDVERLYPHIETPVHIVWGEQDYDNPVHNFRVMEQLNPFTSLTIYKNTKQYPHIESQSEFVEECLDFFR